MATARKAEGGKPAVARVTKATAKAAPVKAAKTSPARTDGPVPTDAPGPGTLRVKDLVERVAAETGAKKKNVRDVVEAVLKILGEALHAGETLALPPFGKAKVSRQKDVKHGEMLVIKLRRGEKPKGDSAEAAEALAEPAE